MTEPTDAERYPALTAAGRAMLMRMTEHPAARVHTYGKAPRPGRKVGHVNVVGDDLDEVAYQARAAASFFAD